MGPSQNLPGNRSQFSDWKFLWTWQLWCCAPCWNVVEIKDDGALLKQFSLKIFGSHREPSWYNCAGPTHWQDVSSFKRMTWLTGWPTDARYRPITTANPIIAIWKIHGNMGKNTVDVVELTALFHSKNNQKWKYVLTIQINLLVYLLASLFDQCNCNNNPFSQHQNDQ